ncbi:S-layer homology domain-containing protein [Butyricicoccus sp. 1XD8-22]|nr:S-layer homology domain-containing protein [Butyricicoccus sp. 1XD8-22]
MKKNKIFNSTAFIMTALIGTAAIVTPFNSIEAKEPTVAATKTFKDVTTTHPYYEMISDMTSQGIISGYADGTFKPNENINRQHAALLINNAVDLETSIPFKAFNDVNSKHPYYQAIRNLQTADLIEADEKGNFNPTKPLTRGEMAKIVATAYDLEVKADYTFEDVEGTEYEEYVKALYSNGLTRGYADGTFKPNAPLTRAHYALFMYQANNLDPSFVAEPIGEEVKESTPIMPSIPASKQLEDYPSEVVVTKDISNWKDLKLPSGNEPTVQEITKIQKKQKEIAQELSKKILVSAEAYLPIGKNAMGGTHDEVIARIAKDINKTILETNQIINYAYGTGEVYEAEKFWLYFDFGSNGISYGYNNR